MLRLVVFSGAGISAQSGLKTFRDSDGLWESYHVYDVATPEAWVKDPKLVMQFYNERRYQVYNAKPNRAHELVALLEDHYDVQVITQNIDDLHERAGSSKVLHLHGEITKCRSTTDESLVYHCNHWEMKYGERCEKGSLLRPHIVWFGEPVPNITKAFDYVKRADIFLIVGTSLQVYPAAGLLDVVSNKAKVVYIDPKPKQTDRIVEHIPLDAVSGMEQFFLKQGLIDEDIKKNKR